MDIAREFPNFQNYENSCWIDSCMVLIAHNKIFKQLVTGCQNSQINKIIEDYKEAEKILNNPEKRNTLEKSRRIMHSLQKTVLCNMKQFLKFKKGQFESAFCALLSLIMHDKSNIKEELESSLIWHKRCFNCKVYSSSVIRKTIITLPTIPSFCPAAPAVYYTCVCKERQVMYGEFAELPDCLIFHFENGAGEGDTLLPQFSMYKKLYKLMSVITFEDSKGLGKDHFVTWVKHPFVEKWLEFNDMEEAIVQFSETKPKFKMENVFIAVYEAYYNLGKMKLRIISNEDISSSNKNIETVQLLDDSASSPGKENILTTRCKSVCEQSFNGPPSSIAVNSLCPKKEQDSADERYNNLKAMSNSLNEKYWNEPSSSTISSSHLEKEFNSFKTSDGHYQRVNSGSPNATSSETDKDQYFGDDLHAEPMDKINKCELDLETRNIIENAVNRTLAALFEQINAIDAQRKVAVDSASCSEKEENMMPTHNLCNKEYLSTEGNESPSDSFTTSNDGHYQKANSSSPNVTGSETDKDQYFGDDLHAEPMDKINKSGLDLETLKVIDNAVDRTLAALFEHFNAIDAQRKGAVDSASCSENVMPTHNLFNEENRNAEGNESPSDSFTTSNDGQYQRDNSSSPNVTGSETNKDQHFSDDLHAEPMDKINKCELDLETLKVIDNAVDRTLAALFEHFNAIDAQRKGAVDSASCSENVMPTHNLCNEENRNAEGNESPSISITNSSFHPEEQFSCTNPASSDSTETDNEDLYFSDDCYAKSGKKRNL